MGKSKFLFAALAMVFFLIVISNSVAGKEKNPIIRRLIEIQETLDYEVIPNLNKCCFGVPKTGQTVVSAEGDDG